MSYIEKMCIGNWRFRSCSVYIQIFCFLFKACTSLSNPQHGSLSTPNGTELEDEAIYECDDGFELVGNSRRWCRSTGSWSGTAPTCKQIGRSLLKENSERIDKKVTDFFKGW